MTSFKSLIAALIIAVATLAPALAAAAEEAVLRTRAVVTGDTVTLGDLFLNAGDTADRPVSRAPAPGERAAIAAGHVVNAARAAGLLWPNHERYTHLIVQRDGVEVSADMQRDAVADAIMRSQATAAPADVRYAVSFEKTPRALHVARGTTPEAVVAGLEYDARTGLFTARVTTPARKARTLTLTGRARQIREVPMPVTAIGRGETITEGMVSMVEMDAARIAPGTALSVDEIIGMSSRTALRAGQPVRVADLRLPVAVSKDSRVSITFEMPGMILTATGRALEDGPMGGLIRVLNTRSRRTIHARIVAPDRVVVESDLPMQLAHTLN
ncbi:flagellar basal body P-ring formation chaperone FlgA [Pyruvatibacter mobilis]|uniref:flagellar basal body P-ring formation chaperone FlgA n=1 Tax=Pyruvatibacter mobilis TaxID=1712261 RepID=UPI003C7BF7C0